MSSILKSESFYIGLAMFSMFFGAGNVIFPLAVGQFAGNQNFFACLGLVCTAAMIPAMGVFAMILFEGNYKNFFGRLGKTPGFLLALATISLLGPLGSTPRCIALAYGTLKGSMLEVSPMTFSAIACGLIFVFTTKQHRILPLLGWVLTPILLTTLFALIFLGLWTAGDPVSSDDTGVSMFLHGLKEGYKTMDLLASFFFSSTILHLLRDKSHRLSVAMRGSLIGTLLLGIVYVCFSYLASFHGNALNIEGEEQLLSAISHKIAGPFGGILASLTVAMACLTTAIALISAFSDFIQKEVFRGKISYESILIVSLIITYAVSTFEFTGISTFLGPILQICYPGLIVLTLLNIVHHFYDFKPVKIPVFATFLASAFLYFY